MTKIHVKASSEYDVIIGRKTLSLVGEFLKPLTRGTKAAVVTDDNVNAIYSDTVTKSLEENGITVAKFVFPNGEKSKNTETLNKIYSFLAENEITRSDMLVALGGGVVGDITGYAAATWLRGVDFAQIPTTLLAQIDSSVGGKTGIDLPSGKNLAGAFKQPKIVIADPVTLYTLPKNILADGIAEAIKYGMIKDQNLFFALSACNIENVLDTFPGGCEGCGKCSQAGYIDDIIRRCVEIKRDVIEIDEFEKGERMLLNFGHTLGHAIEKITGYEVPHGSAVALGMILITKKYAPRLTNELLECIIGYGLPHDGEKFDLNSLLKICAGDKKRDGAFINFIVCPEIGKGEVMKIPIEKFCN